jgi:hypothetical protein
MSGESRDVFGRIWTNLDIPDSYLCRTWTYLKNCKALRIKDKKTRFRT